MNTCPNCDAKSKVLCVVHNEDDEEIYRRKKCPKCGHEIFTVEFEVDRTLDFQRTYSHWLTVNTRKSKYKQK